MITTFIQVGENTVDAGEVSIPKNRDFRDAWQLNGSVIEVDPAKAGAIQRRRIKAEAKRRIYEIASKEDQANGAQRATELVEIKVDGGTWTAEEQAEADLLKLVRGLIKAIRDKSDDLEALSDADLIALDISDDANWKAP